MPENMNSIALSGKVRSIEESHKFADETFYKFELEVPRLSGNCDLLPVTVSEKLLHNNKVEAGDFVTVNGQVRTRNQKGNMRNKLMVFGYAMEVVKISEEDMNSIEDKNVLELEGFVVKKPTLRETKTGRKIAELLIASNRQHNKSDYLPSIAWGVDAGYAKNFEVGEKVSITGRFQSREYTTRGENDMPTKAMAYEISISKINVVAAE